MIFLTFHLLFGSILFRASQSVINQCPFHLFNISFECEYAKNESSWKLSCESLDSESDFPQPLFFIAELYGADQCNTTDDDKALTDSLSNATFSLDSVFYSCPSNVRSIIDFDPSATSNFCKKHKSCLSSMYEINFNDSISTLKVTNLSFVNVFLYSHDLYQVTDLSITNIFNISLMKNSFTNNHDLRHLVLSFDNIQSIPNNIFQKLRNLETLDLSGNKLQDITLQLFGFLPELKHLNISFNLLENIANEAFIRLPKLKSIDISHNKLKSIHEALFKRNSMLNALRLNFNTIVVLQDDLLQNLRELNYFSCSSCGIKELKRHLFQNSIKLNTILLNDNNISYLPGDIFQNLNNLIEVDLSKNKLFELDNNLFRNKSHLFKVNLTLNHITKISGIFDGAPNIRILDLSRNNIQQLIDDHLKNFTDLEFINLSENNISIVQLGKTLLVRARNVFMSRNKISTFNVGWQQLIYLEYLDMDHNQLTELELPPCIQNMKQTITFSFRYNHISRIHMKSLMKDESRSRNDRSLAGCLFNGLAKNFVDITENPLRCDCELYPFYFYLMHKRDKFIGLESFINKERLICAEPEFARNVSVISLPFDTFSCFNGGSCPSPCMCGIRGSDNQTFVNCTGRNLKSIPSDIPPKVTVLYFNQNNLTTLSSLNNPVWKNLSELYVDRNALQDITHWKIPPLLRVLSLKNNTITTLPDTLTKFISNHTNFKLMFAGNGLTCNCSQKILKHFLLKNPHAVIDSSEIVCKVNTNDTITTLPLTNVPDSILCPFTEMNYDETTSVIILCLLFSLLIIIVLVYYKQRQLIVSFIYVHCNHVFHFCFKERDTDDKPFDAFIAYSSNDRDIVMNLLEELENSEPFFQLCIHERDWLPGRFITENIMDSIESSKRTIIVLSDAFILSPWFVIELRAAVIQMAYDKLNRIIVILADRSTSLDCVDAELRQVISKRTYLVWGERWFWEKLRYAMPRKSSTVISDVTPENILSFHRNSSEMKLIKNV